MSRSRPGCPRHPAEARSGPGAGRRTVASDPQGQGAEVTGRLFGRNGPGRHAQLFADGLGDLPERDPLVGHRVERAALRAVLQREPVDARRVEPVHRGPQVLAVADVGGDPFLPREARQHRHEAVLLAHAMHRARQPHPGGAHSLVRDGRGRLLRGAGELRDDRGRAAVLGERLADRQQTEAARDDHWPVGPGVDLAEGLDGSPVFPGQLDDLGKVEAEGQMDDAICLGGRPLESLEIAERAEQRFPARGTQRLGFLLRSGRGRRPGGQRRSTRGRGLILPIRLHRSQRHASSFFPSRFDWFESILSAGLLDPSGSSHDSANALR